MKNIVNTGNLGFKFFILQIISVLITLILILLKVTGSDISWFVSILPLVISILGPLIISVLLLSFLGLSILFRKKDRKETKSVLKKIFKK